MYLKKSLNYIYWLYDEMESGRDKSRTLIFRNYGDTESELKMKIRSI